MPDRELILRCTRESKNFDRQALELEDTAATLLNPADEIGASQEQLDRWADQGPLSQVEDGLYVGGFDALQDASVLTRHNITHILSVCRYHLPVCHHTHNTHTHGFFF